MAVVLNNPSVATNPNYTATGGGLYRNVLQGTPDGIPDIGTANVTLPENTTANQFSIRLDQEFSQNSRIFGRYTYDHNVADDLQTIVRPGFNQPVDQAGNNLTIGHTLILSNTTVNEARFGFSRRNRGLLANNEGAPNINCDDGTISFGVLPTNPAVFIQNTFHWVDTVSMAKGSHGLKFGGEWRYIQDNSDFAVRRPGISFFNGYHRLTEDIPLARHHSRHRSAHRSDRAQHPQLPLQRVRHLPAGRLEAAANLSINAGLRYEWFGRPTEINLLTNMIPGRATTSSPRSRPRRSVRSIRSCRTTTTTSARASASRGIRPARTSSRSAAATA
jgi:hypothetical protein